MKEREQEINRKISGLRGKLANVERDRKAKLQAREKSKEKRYADMALAFACRCPVLTIVLHRMRERETAEANLNEDEFEDFLKDWESREETIRLAEKEEDEVRRCCVLGRGRLPHFPSYLRPWTVGYWSNLGMCCKTLPDFSKSSLHWARYSCSSFLDVNAIAELVEQ